MPEIQWRTQGGGAGLRRAEGGRRPPPLAPGRNTTKSLKSGLKTRLEVKNQKCSYPGEWDTSSPGPHPPSGRDSSPRAPPLGNRSEYAPAEIPSI